MNRSFYESKNKIIIFIEDNQGEKVHVTGISTEYDGFLDRGSLGFYKKITKFVTKRGIMGRLEKRLKGKALINALLRLEKINY